MFFHGKLFSSNVLAFHSTLVEICHGFKLGFCPTYPFKPAKMVGWSACIGCRWVPGHWGVTGEGGRPVRLPLLTQPLGEQLLRYLTMGVSGKVASHCGPFVFWGVWCHWQDQPRWIYHPLHYGGSGDWPSFPVQHLAPGDGSLWQASSLCGAHHEDLPCLKGGYLRPPWLLFGKQPLTRTILRDWLRQIMNSVQIPGNFSTHSFRMPLSLNPMGSQIIRPLVQQHLSVLY